MSTFVDQARFMEACGQTTTGTNPDQAVLYLKLIDEEHGEFWDAKTEANKAGELCDLIWVLIGYGHSRGWPMEKLWAELVRANMAKVDPATGQVRRREDGKVLKPEGWVPPNFEQVLRLHRAQQDAEQRMLGR